MKGILIVDWEKNTGEHVKIAIIDSGITANQVEYCKPIGIYYEEDSGFNLKKEDLGDSLGHGTAVSYLIHKTAANAELFMIKIFHKSMIANEEILLYALNYCITQLSVDIIHLSNGITYCYDIKKLRQICDLAESKGIIILAAFDNFGTLSYPAFFSNVIGVDVTETLSKEGQFFVTNRSDVNIVTANVSYRVPWKGESAFTCNGTSFNICYITACVAKIIQDNPLTVRQVVDNLKQAAIDSLDFNVNINPCINKNSSFLPQKAIIFPFNKELHSLIRYQDNLNFTIDAVYDTKYLGNVGLCAEELFSLQTAERKHTIQNVENISWSSDFDTLIIGHISQIEKRVGKSYLLSLLNQCLLYKKSVYLFAVPSNYWEWKEKFQRANLNFYAPYVDQTMVPSVFNGKLRSIGRPILGVFGTSSKQGKFSLQILLRNHFTSKNYRVGQLGTEPSSPLFGFDQVYPVGYESGVSLTGNAAISYLNYQMGEIEDTEPDIIIVGSQSQTIPQHTGNLQLYVLYQNEIIYGTEPDAVILCVNALDSVDYIKRTVGFLESVIKCYVIELVLFPMNRSITWGTLGDKMEPIPMEILITTKSQLEQEVCKPVFILGEQDAEIAKNAELFFQG